MLLTYLVFTSNLGGHELRMSTDFDSPGPMSLAIRNPARKASYSAVLFIIAKDSPTDTSTTIPSLFLMITLAPLPLELDDPSTKVVHIPSSFFLNRESHFSYEVGEHLCL